MDDNLIRKDSRYPTADRLRSVSWEGRSGNWGKPANEILGEGKDSEASEAIIRVLDQSDTRPVWVCVWGCPQEVAQAIWKVQHSPGMQEGDTPSFLYLVSAVRGMNDPEKPDQESWGGQYEQRDPSRNHWYDGPGAESVRKWLPEIQKDFATRADWMLP